MSLNSKKREITKTKNSNVLCLECHKPFNRSKSDNYFCSHKCWYHFNRRENLGDKRKQAREYYNLKKDNINFKKTKKKHWDKYYNENKDERIKKNIAYSLNRYHTDPVYNVICKVRRRINKVIKAKNIEKNFKTNDAIGCSPAFLKKHIENLFTSGMTWDKVLNSEIEIDHIMNQNRESFSSETRKIWGNPARIYSLFVVKRSERSESLQGGVEAKRRSF